MSNKISLKSPFTPLDYTEISDDNFHVFEITQKIIAQFIDNPIGPYRLNFHQIIILTDGKALHLIDGERIELISPTILLIAREKIHSFVPDNSVRGWVILFTDEFLKADSTNLFSQFFQLSTIPIESQDFFKKITSLTDLMYNCTVNNSSNQLQFVRHLLSAFLVALEEVKKERFSIGTRKKAKNYEIFNSFLLILEANFKSEKFVEFYASHLNVTTRKLGEICKEILGKTTSQIIEERKVIEAKRLLLYSEYSAQQVAYELGFEDHSYFTKVFKRNTHTTPLRYRQENAHT